jgi:hypothetical protein
VLVAAARRREEQQHTREIGVQTCHAGFSSVRLTDMAISCKPRTRPRREARPRA